MSSNGLESDLIEKVRRARVDMPDAVDARLAERVRQLARPGATDRPQWQRVFAMTAALAVVAGVGWMLRPPAPVSDAANPKAAQDPVRPPAPAPVRAQDPEAEPPGPVSLGGARISLWSPIVAVVKRVGAADAAELRVLRYIKSPAGMESDRLRLEAGAEDQDSTFRAFLDGMPCIPGQPLIVELDLVGDATADVVRVAPVRTRELRGLPTLAEGYGNEYATPIRALLAEVLRATEARDPVVRRMAAIALFRWMGNVDTTELVPPKTLWEGISDAEPGLGSVPARLLQLALDADPAIRLVAAGHIPAKAGPAGRRTLHRLAFDREPEVRIAAQRSLRFHGNNEWLSLAMGVEDTFWKEFTSASTWPAWRQRCIDAAANDGITDTLGIWQRQLDKPRPDNHLIGALALGETGLKAAVEKLHGLREVRDPRVRAAAAASRVLLGDERAWRDLEAQAQSGESRAAVFAIDRIRRIERLEALDLIDETAANAAAPIVRAHAAAALRDLAPLARHRVAARLTDLQQDPHPMVRAAAGQ